MAFDRALPHALLGLSLYAADFAAASSRRAAPQQAIRRCLLQLLQLP